MTQQGSQTRDDGAENRPAAKNERVVHSAGLGPLQTGHIRTSKQTARKSHMIPILQDQRIVFALDS